MCDHVQHEETTLENNLQKCCSEKNSPCIRRQKLVIPENITAFQRLFLKLNLLLKVIS